MSPFDEGHVGGEGLAVVDEVVAVTLPPKGSEGDIDTVRLTLALAVGSEVATVAAVVVRVGPERRSAPDTSGLTTPTPTLLFR